MDGRASSGTAFYQLASSTGEENSDCPGGVNNIREAGLASDRGRCRLKNIILPDMTRGIGENISEKQNQRKKIGFRPQCFLAVKSRFAGGSKEWGRAGSACFFGIEERSYSVFVI